MRVISQPRPASSRFATLEKAWSSSSPTSSIRADTKSLRNLLARNMDIFVIHILSQEEVDPELVGDLRLVDCEDEEAAEITISAPLLKRYKEKLNLFVGGLKEWCTQRGITYIFTTNQFPFDKLILNYLRQRGLVKWRGDSGTPEPPIN